MYVLYCLYLLGLNPVGHFSNAPQFTFIIDEFGKPQRVSHEWI